MGGGFMGGAGNGKQPADALRPMPGPMAGGAGPSMQSAALAQQAMAQKNAMGAKPMGFMKKGGKVESLEGKKPTVKGWGAARGARKAKIY
jgi:hypothetical protein